MTISFRFRISICLLYFLIEFALKLRYVWIRTITYRDNRDGNPRKRNKSQSLRCQPATRVCTLPNDGWHLLMICIITVSVVSAGQNKGFLKTRDGDRVMFWYRLCCFLFILLLENKLSNSWRLSDNEYTFPIVSMLNSL